MISSKAFERWLISSTDMPTPGRAIRSFCASSRTGSGSTAGPAPKLKMRLLMRLLRLIVLGSQFSVPVLRSRLRNLAQRTSCLESLESQREQRKLDDVRAGLSDRVEDGRRRLLAQINAGDGGLG